jgi:hypothetical protein
MALTTETYTQGAGQKHQDVAIDPTTLAAGTLVQRCDPVAYPQVGIKSTGTDGNGYDVPAAARPTTGEGS